MPVLSWIEGFAFLGIFIAGGVALCLLVVMLRELQSRWHRHLDVSARLREQRERIAEYVESVAPYRGDWLARNIRDSRYETPRRSWLPEASE